MSHLDVSLTDSAVVYIFKWTKSAIQCMFIVLENSSRQELFLVLRCYTSASILQAADRGPGQFFSVIDNPCRIASVWFRFTR